MSRTLSTPSKPDTETWRAEMPTSKLPIEQTRLPVTHAGIAAYCIHQAHQTYECRMLDEMGIEYELRAEYIRQREPDQDDRAYQHHYTWSTMVCIETAHAVGYFMMFRDSASCVAIRLYQPLITHTTTRKGNPKKIIKKGFAARWRKHRNLVGYGRQVMTGVWGVAGNNTANYSKDECGAVKLGYLAWGGYEAPEEMKEIHREARQIVTTAMKVERAEAVLAKAQE